MTAKQHKKQNQNNGRVVGMIYASKRGTKLAVSKEGAIGWQQESLEPSKNRKVQCRNGIWIDAIYNPDNAQNSFDLACEMGGRSEALRGGCC